MLKKIPIILCVIFSFMYSTVFASSYVVINEVETKDVKNYILEKIALGGANCIVEQSSDSNIVLLMTSTKRSGIFGQYTWSYENRLGFTFVQKDKDVILSVSERCTSHGPDGETSITPVGSADTELPILQDIKGYFNGIYVFGFRNNLNKEDGGFPIAEITPFGVFEKAGIKVGDIIIAVNGEKLKKDKKNNAIIGLFFDKTRPTTQTFKIKRGDVEKTYTLTSEFIPPQFKKNDIPVNTSGRTSQQP